MHTLVFLSTRQVLQCQPAACQALPLLPRELFPLLFKVAFMDKKTVVLRELVHTWPFPLLSFQQLLQECAHCSRALLQERPSTESMQAVILGLTARLHTPETEAGTQPLCRYGLTGGTFTPGGGDAERFPQEVPGGARAQCRNRHVASIPRWLGVGVGSVPLSPASAHPCSQEACAAGAGYDGPPG